jgi:hypothetical protein
MFHNLVLRFIQYLQLVGPTKCHQQINRENILIVGKQSLAAILIVSDYPPTSAINIFFPTVKFIAHAISHFQQRSVSHTLSLPVSLLSCSLSTTFDSVFNPVVHYHRDHSINIFCKESFSFQRLLLHKRL